MGRRYASTTRPKPSAIAAALDAMDAEELRALVGDLLLWLDDRTHARVVNEVVDRAARGGSGWAPDAPTDERVSEVVAYAAAAKRVGYADPSDVDDYLREGANAFLGKEYGTAFKIFRALLLPIGEVDIDLGQHEMVEEVLGVDVADCAAQYVVSAYMTAAPAERANAARSAIDEVQYLGHFWEPLQEMERVAVEPLPGLDDFLPRWRALIRGSVGGERHDDWDADEDRWLREVVQRMEGAEGLAKVARSTKRASDLRAWCRMLVEARDWKAALAAHVEAAEIVTGKPYRGGEFLDGAALAAQELNRRDLPARLERAWREVPSMVRLRRWLGASRGKAVVKRRAAEALEVCPKKAHRQRALLHLLVGDYEATAKLLAAAPGLGWSDSEHPGHLLFPAFCELLGGDAPALWGGTGPASGPWSDLDELGWMSADPDEPSLATPEVHEIIALAGVEGPTNPTARAAVLKAMRRAAEKRVGGVTEHKRRRYYGHAAQLVAACAALDATPESAEWVAAIRAEYRRYPALQRAFDEHLGRK